MERAFLLAFAVLALGAMAIETARHRRIVRQITFRIHVNGTRGKSSVVRLIAAGLRAGGWRVVAKTTGSAARVIFENGVEAVIRRPGRASIGEQRRFVAWAAGRGATAIVVECMAVHPEYQRASEDYLIQANVAVITNVRPDHLETVGSGADATARAFATTIPRGGVVLTAEHDRLPIFREVAAQRRSRLIALSTPPDMPVSAEPFPENTALAVETCRVLGVDPATSLHGMQSVQTDPGALGVYRVPVGGITLTCINAFAANDPVSARLVAARVLADLRPEAPVLVLYNHRSDRPLRARQFVDVIADLRPAATLVVGEAPGQMARWLRARGLSKVAAVPLRAPEAIMKAVAARLTGGGVVLGVGNITGPGMRLVGWWKAAQYG